LLGIIYQKEDLKFACMFVFKVYQDSRFQLDGAYGQDFDTPSRFEFSAAAATEIVMLSRRPVGRNNRIQENVHSIIS
jgi:hypothetical protein